VTSRAGSRPDRQRGVFETLLVLDGRPVELGPHMARLRASLGALFGAPVPEGAREALLERCHGLRVGRARLDVAPDGAGVLGAEVRTAPVDPETVFPGISRGTRLVPLTVPGGWGPHKWADRALLEANAPDGGVSLIVDHDGTVLEASRANVFIVEDGAILTPPSDGRILPGVTRARVIELLAAREAIVSLDRLAAADEVFLTGAVRGIEPVTACEGLRVWTQDAVTGAAAAALRRHWEEGT
jgi:para-aminobenzoate synthetase / 4-amino-4-deoxychorismate lyase